MTEIWQTTNQQPWVEALALNLITAKTRTSFPTVPIGATVLLHTSKSKLWPYWRGLKWTKNLDHTKWEMGKIIAIARVQKKGPSIEVLTREEEKFWDVYHDSGKFYYNSVADFAVRFSLIKRLNVPVEAKGFQAPFARAKKEVIERVLKANPDLKPYF